MTNSMAESRTSIWYEDIERHRQPSLYYLSSEDDPAGPHLIVDWNGAPTDFNEFDFDIMSKLIELKPIDSKATFLGDKPTMATMAGDSNNYPSIFTKSKSTSQTILTENDGANLDFLTVPPMVNSLLKRLLVSQSKDRPTTIPEETAYTSSEVHSTASETNTKNHKTMMKKGKTVKKEREALQQSS